ncbi:uncharacterized protein LOC107359362 [Tetranychus urticae]|uniref:Major facilitator superfamily (MFS) profile domain-containing protein n=1 Tax=Tetranychus urticae TaxID=32264 RepID=T1K1S4_TETUR|nr:uncharacterized protein LOC107359362 [Tetranychus urticae]
MNIKSFFSYLNLTKFDYLTCIFACAFIFQGLVVTQLMEDKVCLNDLKLDPDFCRNFASHANSSETQEILRTANSFKRWQNFVTNAPSLVVSIFMGYWLGNYPKYFKLMMIVPFIGGIGMIILLLINLFAFKTPWWGLLVAYSPYSLSGGTTLLFSAVYTSTTWGTPSHLVIVRFGVLEFLAKMSMLSSSYASGKVLAMSPWISGQSKNYVGVLIVSMALYLFGLLVTILMKPAFTYEKKPEKENATLSQIVSDVFRISRVKECIFLITKQRPNQGRLRLILLLTSGAICNASISGEDGIAYQFAQRVYGLTEDAYTSMLTLVYIPPTIATSIAPSILKYLGLSDSSIAIFGSLSLAAFFTIRGLFLSIRGYIAGYVIGSCGRIASVAIRSLIVFTIPSNESAQVFTISTALETLFGLGAVFLYTTIFSATIADHPGVVMVCVGAAVLYPLSVSCWIRLVQSKSIVDAPEVNLGSKLSISEDKEANLSNIAV